MFGPNSIDNLVRSIHQIMHKNGFKPCTKKGDGTIKINGNSTDLRYKIITAEGSTLRGSILGPHPKFGFVDDVRKVVKEVYEYFSSIGLVVVNFFPPYAEYRY